MRPGAPLRTDMQRWLYAGLTGIYLGIVLALPTAWKAWAGSDFSGLAYFLRPTLAVIGFAILFRLWHRAVRILPRMVVMGVAGFGYYLTATYWLGEAFLEPGQFYSARAAVGLFGAMWVLFPWWMMGALSASLLAPRQGHVGAALALGCGMALAMLALNDFAYGIPLAPVSLVALDTPLIRVASFVGQEALSALLMGVGFVLGSLRPRMLTASCVTLSAALVASLALPRPEPLISTSARLIALLQPGAQFFTHDDPLSATRDIAALSATAFQRGADLVVSPENVLPFDLEDASDPLSQIILALPPPGRHLIVGYTHVEAGSTGSNPLPMNKLALVTQGRIISTYAKSHLVPFGEYVPQPIRALGFDVMAGPAGGFGRGDRLTLLSIPDLPPAATAICYESILSGAISRETAGAGWLLNPTSERMFGRTLASRQLLDYARLRAIETGLPVLRAATTGMTAHVDGHGFVRATAAPDVQDMVLTRLTVSDPTPFRSIGQTPYIVALVALMLVLLAWKSAAARGLLRNGVHDPDAVTTR